MGQCPELGSPTSAAQTPSQSTKTLSATQLRRKGRKTEKEKRKKENKVIKIEKNIKNKKVIKKKEREKGRGEQPNQKSNPPMITSAKKLY